MRNRACAHCGEATLSPWKLAMSGPMSPVRCRRCSRHNTTATKLRLQMTVGALATLVATVLVAGAWGRGVGVAVFVAGILASMSLCLREAPTLRAWPERSLLPAAMIAALVPTALALVAGWDANAPPTMSGKIALPFLLWVVTTTWVVILGAPIVWLLRRVRRQGYVAYALAAALPGAALGVWLASSVNPKAILLALVGAATGLVFRHAARRRLFAAQAADAQAQSA